MAFEDPSARRLTLAVPGDGQIWLYELNDGQVSRSFTTKRGCPPSSKAYLLGHLDFHEKRTVLIYIPRSVIRSTLEVIRNLPAYSYICDDDFDNIPEVNLVAGTGESKILDISIRGVLIPESSQLASEYLPLRPFGLAAPTRTGTGLCISYWLNAICSASEVFHQTVISWGINNQHIM
jgi:hypothetical protein